MGTKNLTRGLLLLGLIAVLAAAAYWLRAAPETAAKTRAPAPVTVARAALRDMPVNLSLVGRAEAYENVLLRARVDGQVSAVLFAEGQHVRQGDILIRLDDRDAVARLAQAEATLARDQAQLEKARNDLERYQSLRQKGFISDEKLNEVRTALAAQEAALKSSMAGVELAKNQLEYTRLRAPFDGVVGAKLVFPGATVKINDTGLVQLNRNKPLWVAFAVAEKYLPQIQAAMKQGQVPVAVMVPGGRQYPALARFLDNGVDPASGTIRMKARVGNEDESLTAGQFLNVSLTLETRKQVVTVPVEAVQQGPEGSYAYRVKDDNTVEMRRISVATRFEGAAAIDQGLDDGDVVVTDGHLRLSPGAPVALRQSSAASADAGAKPGSARP